MCFLYLDDEISFGEPFLEYLVITILVEWLVGMMRYGCPLLLHRNGRVTPTTGISLFGS
jgi:hypothetical protein